MLNGATPPSPFTDIATGTGAAAESETDTALGAENTQYGAERVTASCSYVEPGISVWTHLYAISGGTVTIRELGIFNDVGMFLRHVFSENKVLSDGESIEITISNTMVRRTV
jgi:hypothetical protein